MNRNIPAEELIDFFPVAFSMMNSSHEMITVNREFKELTGYDQGEISSLFYNKEEAEKFKEKIKEATERIVQEIFLLTRDGRGVLVNLSAVAERNNEGNFSGYFLSIFDLSNIKEFQTRLEEKVKEKTEELEEKAKEIADSRIALMNILEETDEAWRHAEREKDKTMAIINDFIDGLILFDKQDLITMVNPKAEKFLSIDAKEVLGLKAEDLEEKEHLHPLIELLTGPAEDDSRKEMEVTEGQTLEVSIIPIIAQEERIGTLVALHDITREKMVEAMKSEFVSIAAHQLRTPLSAIKWTTRMLLDGDLGELNEGQKELTEKAYLSNERMVNLINDLLNVSRIEEGRYLYKPEMTQIEEIITPMATLYKEEAERRGIQLKINLPKDKTPTVVVDKEKIALVIQNFLDNAMKYSLEKGEIILTVSYNNKTKKIKVSVKDNGVGIPKDQQTRLFRKFFRAANVIKLETEGSGLGLFICKNIVEAHEGEIGFESEEGKGSTFYFELPVKDQKEFEEFLKRL